MVSSTLFSDLPFIKRLSTLLRPQILGLKNKPVPSSFWVLSLSGFYDWLLYLPRDTVSLSGFYDWLLYAPRDLVALRQHVCLLTWWSWLHFPLEVNFEYWPRLQVNPSIIFVIVFISQVCFKTVAHFVCSNVCEVMSFLLTVLAMLHSLSLRTLNNYILFSPTVLIHAFPATHSSMIDTILGEKEMWQ